jgi:hypothetical protein
MRAHSLELIGDAMLPKPEPACLVMADISGYTGYLAGVELDHAQDILADLIDTIVGALRPPFQLSKLEGDAAFVYLVAPEFDGSHLQDTIESAYFTFRRRQRDIKQASICECDACRLIPTLDLKFIAHYGQIAKQTMSGQEELIGRDVILVHRLLKNNVEAKLARHAYILYTDAFAQRTGMNPQAQGLIEHHETVEIIGDVRCWLRDLEAGWQADAARKRVEVSAAEAIASFVIDVEAARQTTWEFLTAPGHRVMWTAGATGVEEDVANGRRGAGTVNHCMHGKDVIIEEVLDWQPPDYLTRRIQLFDTGVNLTLTHALSDGPSGGTRIEVRVAPPPPELMERFVQIGPMMQQSMQASGEALVKLLNEAAARIRASTASAPEVPASAARFATQPVHDRGSQDRPNYARERGQPIRCRDQSRRRDRGRIRRTPAQLLESGLAVTLLHKPAAITAAAILSPSVMPSLPLFELTPRP